MTGGAREAAVARRLTVALLALTAMLLGPARGAPGYRGAFADPAAAERICRNWIDERVHFAGGWAGSLQPEIAEVDAIADGDTLLAWCFRIAPTGYVVVPRRKALFPIKAWSDQSDVAPATREDLFALLRATLSRSGRAGEEPAAEVRQAWDRLDRAPESHRAELARGALAPSRDGGPLLTTLWWQGEPYNDFCPMGDGGRCLVGCVATAAAQILRYHGWPGIGSGEHNYLWDGDQSCGGNVGGDSLSAQYTDAYDWALMPDDCDDGCSPQQRAALAELNHEVGVAFEMNYGHCCSYALTLHALEVFPAYFRCDPSIDAEYRHDHTADSWFALIAEQIDAGQPMQYSISDHSCVCDGYRTQSGAHQLHINYGFAGGAHNGWYAVDDLYGSPYPEGEILIRNIVPSPNYLVRADGTGDFPTLQAAIDALDDGDVILLADGVYRGAGNRDVDLRGKALRLQPQRGPAGQCVIDCEGSPGDPHRAFVSHAGEGSATQIEGLVIVGGYADRGGAILCENASPTLLRCTLVANAASNAGAGVYCASGAQPTLRNVIVAFSPLGEALGCDGSSALVLSCCNLWGNAGGDWVGCVASQQGESGNLGADPDFCDAPSGDYGLRVGSPCAPEANPDCGQIGALPLRCGNASHYVIRPDGSGDFPTVQAAMDAAFDGDTILLSAGVFSGAGNVDLDFLGKAITVRSLGGNAEDCVINCRPEGSTELHRAFIFHSGEGPASVLDGITIMNGDAPSGPYPYAYQGGAIVCGEASPTIRRCRFQRNRAPGYMTWLGKGGAVYSTGDSLVISDCYFERNSATAAGAIACLASTRITDCVFLRNAATGSGGAVYSDGGVTVRIDRCDFSGNAGWSGGGINAQGDTLLVEACTFTGNSAQRGGAILCGGPYARVRSCTLVANLAAYGRPGSGLFSTGSRSIVERTIMAFGSQGTGAYGTTGSDDSFACCDIHGNAGGDWTNGIEDQLGVNGNISLDPLFCGEEYAGDPYTLWDTSPCAPYSPQNPECDLVGAWPVGCSVQAIEGAPPEPGIGLWVASPAVQTRIVFGVPRAVVGRRVTLDIYDLAGRHVARLRDGPVTSERGQASWDGATREGARAGAGLYFVRLRLGSRALTRPFVHVR